MRIEQFLLARLAEDDRASHRLAGLSAPCDARLVAAMTADHIAKREIIALHRERALTSIHWQGPRTISGSCQICRPSASHPCLTLRLLASPYNQHPDFEPTWQI